MGLLQIRIKKLPTFLDVLFDITIRILATLPKFSNIFALDLHPYIPNLNDNNLPERYRE